MWMELQPFFFSRQEQQFIFQMILHFFNIQQNVFSTNKKEHQKLGGVKTSLKQSNFFLPVLKVKSFPVKTLHKIILKINFILI